MLFPTTAFALFYAAVLLLWWTLPARRPLGRKLLLLAANLFFYAWWSWKFALMLLASALANHALASAAAAAGPRGRARIVRAGVAANVALLAFFKYAGFILIGAVSPAVAALCRAVAPEALDAFVSFQTARTIPFVQDIVLPIGISFYTFQNVSYLVDVGRGSCRPARSALDYANFLAFFPKLCAGPIARPDALLRQMEDPPGAEARIDTGRATWLIAFGLLKKTVLANFLAESLVDPFFGHASSLGAVDAVLGAWGYAVQLYLDFSAYTDMAVGLALLLGFSLPVNFDAPYFAGSLGEFWRRWHISLSSWLRDYLYIPLGGSRRGTARTCLNLFLVMLLGGLWHGAGWMFLLWGALHGALLALERLALGGGRAPAPGPAALALRRFLTFNAVSALWLFFRAGTGGLGLSGAAEVFGAFTRFRAPALSLSAATAAVLAAGFLCQLADAYRPRKLWDAFGRLPAAVQGLAAAAAATLVLGLGPSGIPAFIYFQF